LIGAEAIDKAELGFAGRPVGINADLLRSLLNAGYLPVISPVAYDATNPNGGALNVNGDDAAAAIAIALRASELLLVADVAGVLDSNEMVISSLDHAEATDLAQKAVVKKGMKAKLEAGFAALAGGVARVRIADLDGLEDATAGTSLTLAQSLIT
jgi:acetylglutamate kinase